MLSVLQGSILFKSFHIYGNLKLHYFAYANHVTNGYHLHRSIPYHFCQNNNVPLSNMDDGMNMIYGWRQNEYYYKEEYNLKHNL